LREEWETEYKNAEIFFQIAKYLGIKQMATDFLGLVKISAHKINSD
jgi:hypothetical protein